VAFNAPESEVLTFRTSPTPPDKYIPPEAVARCESRPCLNACFLQDIRCIILHRLQKRAAHSPRCSRWHFGHVICFERSQQDATMMNGPTPVSRITTSITSRRLLSPLYSTRSTTHFHFGSLCNCHIAGPKCERATASTS
jgi:hypothetical protein